MVVLYPAATSADSPLAHMVVHPLQLALVVLFHPPTGANTALALGQLALCGGGLYIYIYSSSHIPIPLAGMFESLYTLGSRFCIHIYSMCRLAWWGQGYFEQCVCTYSGE